LRGLVAILPPAEAEGLKSLLDEAVADEVREAEAGPDAAIAGALGVSDERAGQIRGAAVVASLEALGAGAEALIGALPEALRPTASAPPEAMRTVPMRKATPPSDNTLAAGRPGSKKPVADSATRGHQHSVVHSDDPHAESRLSSTRGETRSGRTLADGKPGSERPVSKAGVAEEG
jgi:hypothetical protein